MQQKPRLARGLSQEKRFFGYEADQPEQQYQHYQQSSSYPYQSCWEANMDGSIEPHENDVLMGRGGLNNKHSGNEQLRQLARQYGGKYKSLTKKEKSDLSRYLVRRMRELDPPARFLKRIQQTASWEEVGDDIAREKASQVLRDAVSGLLDDRKPGAEADEDSTNDNSTTGIGIALVPTVSAQTSTDMEEHDYSESSPQHSASSSRHHNRQHQQYEPPRPHTAPSMMMPSQVSSSSPYSPVPYPPYHSQQQHHHHHYPLQHQSSPPPYQLHPSSALPPPPPLLPPLDTTAETPPLERKRRRQYAAEAIPPLPPPVPHAAASSALTDGSYGPMIRRYHSENTYLTLAQQQQQHLPHQPPRRPARAARQRSANSTDEMGQLLAGELLESDSEDDVPPTTQRSA